MTVEMGKVQVYAVLGLVARIRIWEHWSNVHVDIFNSIRFTELLQTSVLLPRCRITENTLTPFPLTPCTRRPSSTSYFCESTILASLRCARRGELRLCVVATDMASQSVTTLLLLRQYSDNIITGEGHTCEQMCAYRTGKGGQEGLDAGLRGDGDALCAGSWSCIQETDIQNAWNLLQA